MRLRERETVERDREICISEVYLSIKVLLIQAGLDEKSTPLKILKCPEVVEGYSPGIHSCQ